MTLEEMKKKFEEDYPEIVNSLQKHFGKGGYTAMMLFFFNIHKEAADEACKKQREICSMELPMYPFTPNEFDRWQLAILNAPSPKETK